MTVDGPTGKGDRLAALMKAALPPGRINRLGVAVSGGGDSMALLHLARGWARAGGASVSAATVDHGLRPAARAEAAMVAEVCEGMGVAHRTLTWSGWDGSGNLQDKARRARYRLLADWALDEGLDAVALAHTADDQAETFVMRLARGAGVDGLSAMAARRRAGGVDWVRPLLGAGREELRDYLRAGGHGWVEDPSNADPRFLRVQVRQVIEALAPLGIDAAALLATTQRLGEAREALELAAQAAARRIAVVEAGDVVMAREGLLALPAELKRRLLSHALSWVASADYGPRHESLAEGLRAIEAGREMTLHGCQILRKGGTLRICRELQAVKELRSAPGALWDRRWRVVAPEETDLSGLEVGALGEAGIVLCPDWREAGLPRASLLSAPAIWREGALVAAPLAGKALGWRAELARGGEDYFSTILSH